MKKISQKIMIVFGTRPEAIKMAPVIFELKKNGFWVKVIISSQHQHLLDDVLKVFAIRPDYDLKVMVENQTLFHITETVLKRIEPILLKEKPDLLMVHGDTTTTLAAALAAFYRHIPVAHVEAGLRTGDRDNPYPEEMNRLLTDDLTDIYFAPTETARQNLLKENKDPKKIVVVGNTVIDALLSVARKDIVVSQPLRKVFSKIWARQKIVLLTAHRRENFGKPLEEIFQAVKKIAAEFSEIEIIYPVHPNPNVHQPASKILAGSKNIHLITPLNYLDIVAILKKCYLVITDSGGLQEEAPSLGKPVLVLRRKTERPEAVLAGTVKLLGNQYTAVYSGIKKLLTDDKMYQKMSKAVNPYGDGKAAERIVHYLKFYFGLSRNKPREFRPNG